MEPLTILISGVIVGGAFVFGLYRADRAYNRDRKQWQTERVDKTKMIAAQAETIERLQYAKNELTESNEALQAQNWRLAQQRFALMGNGQEAEAA